MSDNPDLADRPSEFAITATASPLEVQPRTLKQGDAFAVFDQYGDIRSSARNPGGLFYRDTRHLSRLELRLNNVQPLLLSSTIQDDNALLAVDLTNADRTVEGRKTLAKDQLHLSRTKFLWQAASFERLSIRNFSDQPQQIELAFAFAGDFADLFEVRGQTRARRGVADAAVEGGDAVRLRYRGLDDEVRLTVLRFDPPPQRLEIDRAQYVLTLAPGERRSLFILVSCVEPELPTPRFFGALRTARRRRLAEVNGVATIETSNARFNEVLARAMTDLSMLATETGSGLYPYAGVPWFSTAFGRDGVITAMQTLWLFPRLAAGVLRFLAATQATRMDATADAEPGKILHERRAGEMAALGEVPFAKYYGSIDATPLFIMLAAQYFERTGDVGLIREVWPNIKAAIEWIDRYGDRDGDGFVEYARSSDQGLVNQGWKDSHDSIFHADGTTAAQPIALVEVQAYVFAAKHGAAALARAIGEIEMAELLAIEAEELQQRFEAAFWCEELGAYALALDGAKRQCQVVTSNAGHALFAGIASEARAHQTAQTLNRHNMFSGWGIRTLAVGSPRYNPMSYHNGSVWPHDNALIGLGFARYGLRHEAVRLLTSLYEAAQHMDLARLPELFCGFSRGPKRGPTLYPVACSPQAWAAAAPFALLQACLGLEIDAQADEIRFRKPMLPGFLTEVLLRDLRVGGSSVDVELRGVGGDVAVHVVRREGAVRVVTIC